MTVSQALLDWSGALLIAVSLVFLVRKHPAYWHFGNASLLPYGLLYLGTGQYILAGLQVSYLIFGLHGMLLWALEARREERGIRFHEGFWYNLGWVMTLGIFAYTVSVTRFTDSWSFVQFTIAALSLLANWATTRRWIWSWLVWMTVNAISVPYYLHLELYALTALQGVLFGMSVWGYLSWRRDGLPASVAVHA
ncbi:nicotinamide mononucleotide transporter [Deinococcus sp. SDU3-2]|uniref:Nicotinamide mononucleotide transporter n=1 Tax=Deinococcus terrestris TaxID=2651870 RepID=A0A7X1NYI6_9DEIO|nr:nicotinamide mononucleotide transporter [Deinococcus terrestris]